MELEALDFDAECMWIPKGEDQEITAPQQETSLQDALKRITPQDNHFSDLGQPGDTLITAGLALETPDFVLVIPINGHPCYA